MADPMALLSSTQALALAGGIAAGLVLGYFMFPTMRQAKRLVLEVEQVRADLDSTRGDLETTRQELDATSRDLSHARLELERSREELEEARAGHERWRESVSDHFVKTADLVGEMTRSYAAVYDHLASGAQRFAGEAFASRAVDFGPSPAALHAPAAEAGLMESDDTSDAADTDVPAEDDGDGDMMGGTSALADEDGTEPGSDPEPGSGRS